MKKHIFLIVFAFLSQYLMAVPAFPVRKTLKMLNGETKSVILRGDEYFSYYTDDAGVFYYKEFSSGVLKKYSDAEKSERINYSESQRRDAADRREAARTTRGALTGQKTGLVILAEFTDVKFTVGSHDIFEDFFNKPNYTEYGNVGSVHDYFYDQSYQQFNLDFDVVGPVQLPNDRAFYGEPVEKDHDKNARQFAVDAITAAADYVDFSKYDWDNDGTVDQVFIIFAGHNEAEGGPEESIWPHEWTIGSSLSFNGVKLSTYGCASELKGASGSNLCGVGTACHEFSHCLGLPDTYDTSTNNNFGMGNWDIMASGNYLGESCSPMAYSAFERWMCGWLKPVEINTEYSVRDMRALEDEPEAYILYNDGNRDEFYLLENRQLPKWGSSLKAHGLMVMHIDYDDAAWYYNQVNTATGHQRMTFIPADNMMMSGNYDGDPFPGTRNVRELTDTSSPSATVYNPNTDDTNFMGKPITNISETLNGLISFDAMKGVILPPNDFVADIQPSGAFTLSWQEMAGVPRYELMIKEIPGLKENPYESFLLEEDLARSCYASKVNSLNNVAGKLDQYTKSKGWSGSNLFLGPKGLQLGTKAKVGSLMTPTIVAPYYGLTTALLKVSPVTAGETVKVKVNLYFDGSAYGSYSLTVSSEITFTLVVPEVHSNLAFEIVPDKPANVSYFSLHSGNFDEEDFSKYDASAPHAYAEYMTSTSFTVDKNSYLFEEVKNGCIYLCKVRAVFDDDSHYGKWTSEILVEPGPTGIESVKDDSLDEDVWYDLQGRKVNTEGKQGFFINKRGKYFIE